MVLSPPYVSPATAARRADVAVAAMDRAAGIDVNVSNLTVASHAERRAVRITRVERDAPQKQRDRGRARRERRRQRELERSRRAMNQAQYQLSKRQAKRARRRAEAGLPPVETVPMGPRNAREDGVPLQSHRRDHLSNHYRRMYAAQVADAAAAVRARRDRAREVAAAVVATHGYRLVVEDCNLAAWSRLWGRAAAAFAPGTLLAAIDREARAVAARAGGKDGVTRAATRTTALSQHCPCGARVAKRLADRVHRCAACGLCGDRDAVAAVLGSFVVLDRGGDPASARVDYDAAVDALPAIRRALERPFFGWQDTRSESTDLCARDGSFVAWRTSSPDPVVVARRIVGDALRPTLNETSVCWTTSERTRTQANMSGRYDLRSHLRDTS